jgi:hypothetical protein
LFWLNVELAAAKIAFAALVVLALFFLMGSR